MERIKELKDILKKLELDPQRIDQLSPTDLLESIGFDSIRIINYIVLLEDSYNIEIVDEDLLFDKYSTLEKIMVLLEKYIK